MRGALARGLVAGLVLMACAGSRSRPPPGGEGSGGIDVGGGGSGGDGGVPADGGGRLCAEPTLLDSFSPQRIVYVSPAGNDQADGLTEGTAWRSLVNAARLQPGDEVRLAPGRYPGGALLRGRGGPGLPIVLRASGAPGSAVLEGLGSETALTLRGAAFVVLDGLVLTGGTDAALRLEPDEDGRAAETIQLLGVQLAQGQGALLRARYAVDVLVQSSLFDSPETGFPQEDGRAVSLVGVRGARLVGNVLRNVLADTAVEARAGSSDILVDGNAFFDVQEGVSLGGRSARQEHADPLSTAEATAVVAVNNTFVGAVAFPFVVAGCARCVVAYNSYAGAGARGAVVSRPGATGAQAPGAVSVTTGLVVTSNIFAFQGAVPPALLAVQPEDQGDLVLGPNLFFATGGNVSAAPSAPSLDLALARVDVDPLFTSVAGRDLSLQPGSPALGAGVALPGVRRDGTGACRTAFHLGAF